MSLLAAAHRRNAGGGGGGAPLFDREILRASGFANSGSHAFTLTSSVAVGERLVVTAFFGNAVVQSVADTAGNTYTLDQLSTSHSNLKANVLSTLVTSALVSGDVVTITFTGTFSTWRAGILCVLTNTTAPDASGYAYSFTTNGSVSTSADTTDATAVIGAVASSSTITPTSTDGTQSGSVYSFGGGTIVLLYKDEATTGTKSIGVTVASSLNLARVISAYK